MTARWRARAAATLGGAAMVMSTVSGGPALAASGADIGDEVSATEPDASWFVPGPGLPGGPYRDVGVTDIDRDGLLDVIAPAHAFQAGLWRNRGDFELGADVIDQYGLGQDPEFPFWESGAPESLPTDGLYMYRSLAVGGSGEKPSTIAVVWKSPSAEPLDVHLTFYAPTAVVTETRASVEVVQTTNDDGRPIWQADGTIQYGGAVTLKPRAPGLPIDVRIDPDLSPSRINVGPRLVHPSGNSFTLNAKDRHGIALADFAGDSAPDALWAVGGMQDHASIFAGLIDDQVYVNRNGVQDELGPESGVTKTDCRGYESRVVDADGDGVMDLYVGCLGAQPQLWLQTEPGDFTNEQLSAVSATTYGSRWLDLDNDNQLELVITGGRAVIVYARSAGGDLVATQRVKVGRDAGQSQNLQAADYDGDGYEDLLIASKTGSALLRNNAGTLTRKSLSTVGLPSAMVGASWADIDSDGFLDLLVMPGGLYMQKTTGRFVANGVLDNLTPRSSASATFADLDNDGARDIVADIDGSLGYVARSTAPQGSWLQVDLVGPDGNASAVGAYVTVTSNGRVQRHWVGDSDSSVFSQTHHRLYFGLGAAGSIDTLKVSWPDGTSTTLRDVDVDRRVVVKSPNAS